MSIDIIYVNKRATTYHHQGHDDHGNYLHKFHFSRWTTQIVLFPYNLTFCFLPFIPRIQCRLKFSSHNWQYVTRIKHERVIKIIILICNYPGSSLVSQKCKIQFTWVDVNYRVCQLSTICKILIGSFEVISFLITTLDGILKNISETGPWWVRAR